MDSSRIEQYAGPERFLHDQAYLLAWCLYRGQGNRSPASRAAGRLEQVAECAAVLAVFIYADDRCGVVGAVCITHKCRRRGGSGGYRDATDYTGRQIHAHAIGAEIHIAGAVVTRLSSGRRRRGALAIAVVDGNAAYRAAAARCGGT